MKYNIVQREKNRIKKVKSRIFNQRNLPCKIGQLDKKPFFSNSRVGRGLFVVGMVAFMAYNGYEFAQAQYKDARPVKQPGYTEKVEKPRVVEVVDKDNYKLKPVGTTEETRGIVEMKKDEESKEIEHKIISVVEDFGRKAKDFRSKYPTLSALFAVGLQLLGGLAAYIYLRLKL